MANEMIIGKHHNTLHSLHQNILHTATSAHEGERTLVATGNTTEPWGT